MKIKKWFEVFALSMAISAVGIFTFYLATLYEHPIIFTEAYVPLRIWEIICGIITIPILIKLLWDKVCE